jgi:hypothetical protein
MDNRYRAFFSLCECNRRSARRRVFRFSSDLGDSLLVVSLNESSTILSRRNFDWEQLAHLRSPKFNFVNHK